MLLKLQLIILCVTIFQLRMCVLSVRVTQFDLQHLGELDGLSEWREREAADLSALVQGRLHALQNPTDCTTARKLTCNLNKGSLNSIIISNV